MYLIADDLGTEGPYAQENYTNYNVVLREFFSKPLLGGRLVVSGVIYWSQCME